MFLEMKIIKQEIISLDKTIKDIIDSMTEEQQNAMYALIGMMIDEQNDNEKSKH